jgi:hypothetical protein
MAQKLRPAEETGSEGGGDHGSSLDQKLIISSKVSGYVMF